MSIRWEKCELDLLRRRYGVYKKIILSSQRILIKTFVARHFYSSLPIPGLCPLCSTRMEHLIFNSGLRKEQNHKTRGVLLQPHARRQGVKRVYGLTSPACIQKASSHGRGDPDCAKSSAGHRKGNERGESLYEAKINNFSCSPILPVRGRGL